MAELYRTFFALAFSVSAVSFTIARTKVSEPLRTWVAKKNTWLGNLITCPYCVSHWLSFAAVGIYRPYLVQQVQPFDFLVTAMAMVAVSCIVTGLITQAITR